MAILPRGPTSLHPVDSRSTDLLRPELSDGGRVVCGRVREQEVADGR